MSENTDAEELDYQLRLGKVINKQPKLFQRWTEIKEQFSVLGIWDSPLESFFGIEDVFKMINEAFDDSDFQPAIS